jgi:hypothetical protein
MDVREVDFDIADRLDGVGDRAARVGVGAGIQHRPLDIADARVEQLDDLALTRTLVD